MAGEGTGLSIARGIFFHICEFKCFSTMEVSAYLNRSHRLSNTKYPLPIKRLPKEQILIGLGWCLEKRQSSFSGSSSTSGSSSSLDNLLARSSPTEVTRGCGSCAGWVAELLISRVFAHDDLGRTQLTGLLLAGEVTFGS